MSKVVSLSDLAGRIGNGATIVLGGSFAHRFPGSVVRELVRRGVRGLDVVKPSPGYDLDLLVRAGAVRRARVGIAAMDEQLGLLPSYRRAVEAGEIELEEHSCITLVAGMRATAAGVPFMPVAGLQGSDIPVLNGWRQFPDPYGEAGEAYVVPPIRPDFAVIHANAVDADGNASVLGSPHWDRIATRAADRVLVTAERLVSAAELRDRPESTVVPGFMTEAASIVPRGAWPGSTHPEHEADTEAMRSYLEPGEEPLRNHMRAAPELDWRVGV